MLLLFLPADFVVPNDRTRPIQLPFGVFLLVSEFRLLGVNELNICGSVHHAFVVKLIPTRCNNCGLFFANAFAKNNPHLLHHVGIKHDARNHRY